jgi:hypothetical protein
MSLTTWELSDVFDFNALKGNFNKIDAHDHSGPP